MQGSRRTLQPARACRLPDHALRSATWRTPHAFNMERAGHVYSRISNPTVAVLEERMAALEGGVGAIATASGQAALHLAVATIMDAGSHIVASSALYGGSHNLLGYTLKRFGIETTFVSPRDPKNFLHAIKPNTRLLFGETLGNPGLDVLDFQLCGKIAHDAGLPFREPLSPRRS
jgi:O-acetylhomoserine (thiol)-lyase